MDEKAVLDFERRTDEIEKRLERLEMSGGRG